MVCNNFNLLESIQIAQSQRELSDALSLVYRCYLDTGLIAPHPLQVRVLEQHALPSTEVVVARVRDEIFATASIVRDDFLGLPMEASYAEEVDRLRNNNQRLAEVSCLADRRCDVSRSVIKYLMAFIAQCAWMRGVDQILIAVHPRHAKFYSRYLGFEEIGGLHEYESVRGNPAIALALDLNSLESNSPAAFGRLFGTPFSRNQLQYRDLPLEARSYLEWLISATKSRPYDEQLRQRAARAS